MKKSEEKLLTLEISVVKSIYEDTEFGDILSYSLECDCSNDNGKSVLFETLYPNKVILPNSNIIKSYIMEYMNKFIKEYEKLDVS